VATTEFSASTAHPPTRELRGIALYRDHADEIRFEDGVWFVPSEHEATSVYEVTLGRRGESCECQDFEIRCPEGGCKHIVTATIAKAKSTVCSCCGNRVPWKFATEVTEDHALLAWFPGDRLCGDCVRGGFWS
jgi:hypothetical protein